MARPTTQSELLDAMDQEYLALLTEVGRCPAQDIEIVGACEHWSVKDLLAHLDAWHELILGWDRVGAEGGKPAMPAPGLTWKDTPLLNDQIWQRTKADSWVEVKKRLDRSHRAVRAMAARYEPDDLFTKRRFGWTGSTSVGSYAVSATSSHYDWARKLIRSFNKARVEAADQE